MNHTFMTAVCALMVAMASFAVPLRFFEAGKQVQPAAEEYWHDSKPYSKAVWRDGAFQLEGNGYYQFGNRTLRRHGREDMTMTVKVRLENQDGDFVFAVGTRDNHDPGCRMRLARRGNGFVPQFHIVCLRGVNFTGNTGASASDEFLVQAGNWVTLSLNISRKEQKATLWVDGRKAVEHSIAELGEKALLALPDTPKEFYFHIDQKDSGRQKAFVEHVSVVIDQEERRTLPDDLKNRGSLLNNAAFKCDETGLPLSWGLETPGKDSIQFDFGRLDGIRFQDKGTLAITQTGIKLKRGEKYRIGAWIRAKDFHAHKSGLCIFNYQWQNEAKTRAFPVDTAGEWVLWEEDVICPNPGGQYSLNSAYYGFAIVAWDITGGTLDVRNPYLVAQSEEAERFSEPCLDASNPDNVSLVPVTPLHIVQQTNAILRFYSTYDFGLEEPHYKVTAYLLRKGEKFTSGSAPLKNRFAEISFPGPLTLGEGDIQVDLYRDGRRVKYQFYHFNVVKNDVPEQGKRLNNCVTELFSGMMPGEGLSFHLNDWQWICMIFPTLKEGTVVQLDGQDVRLYGDGFAPECMRFLGNGDHTLLLPKGVSGPVTLRIIPEILIYPFQIAEKQNLDRQEYGVDFFRKHIWHACNLHNLATSTNPYSIRLFKEVEDRGARILQCAGLLGDEYFDTKKALQDMWYGWSGLYGQTIDEIAAGDNFTLNMAMGDAFWLSQKRTAPVYVWTVHSAPYNHPTTQMNLLAGLSAAAGGRGKILSEVYFTSYPDETELAKRLEDEKEIARQMREAFPQLPRLRMEIGCSYGASIGYYWSDCYPEADLKVALDRYWNMVATDPVYAGTYGIGDYCLNHADEELFRWIGAMFRHYFVEGKTELLSEKYGFTLVPGHLKNGDFREKLDGWAASGSVASDTIKGYGNSKQRRIIWRNHKDSTIGDHLAVFRNGGNAGMLSQKMKGLMPGRQYALTYVTAYREELDKGARQRTRHEILPTIEGGEFIPEKTVKENCDRCSLQFFRHRYVFTATATEGVLTLTDKRQDRTSGDILMNAVSIRPYFDN